MMELHPLWMLVCCLSLPTIDPHVHNQSTLLPCISDHIVSARFLCHNRNIKGASNKMSDIHFSLKSVPGVGFDFFRVYENQKHLGTLIITINYLKCVKDAQNACINNDPTYRKSSIVKYVDYMQSNSFRACVLSLLKTF